MEEGRRARTQTKRRRSPDTPVHALRAGWLQLLRIKSTRREHPESTRSLLQSGRGVLPERTRELQNHCQLSSSQPRKLRRAQQAVGPSGVIVSNMLAEATGSAINACCEQIFCVSRYGKRASPHFTRGLSAILTRSLTIAQMKSWRDQACASFLCRRNVSAFVISRKTGPSRAIFETDACVPGYFFRTP